MGRERDGRKPERRRIGRRPRTITGVTERDEGDRCLASGIEIEKAFHRLTQQILHGPLKALTEEPQEASPGGHTLLEAVRKLFRLEG